MSERPGGRPRWVPWLLLAVGGVVVTTAALHAPVLVRYRREQAAAKRFEAAGGRCHWQPASPPLPLSLLGETYAKLFRRLRALYLNNTQVTDAELVHLKGLAGLQQLDLGNTKITNAALVHLKGLAGLQGLDLRNTQITDAGLVHLRGLAGLQGLSLWNTKITDSGLVHLKGLAGLRELYLGNTQITDAGVAGLKAARPGLRVTR